MNLYEKLQMLCSKARIDLSSKDLAAEATNEYRLILQMYYALELSKTEGERFHPLIEKAADKALEYCDIHGAVTREFMLEVESLMEPLAVAAKSYSLICIGHAHIDMNWMWGFDETVSITHDTFRTVLDLMEEYPGFTFAQSQASVYRIMEEYFPEMTDEVKKRVAEGRWEVTASTWVEADRNMPNMESIARHLLYTKKYLSNLLNIAPESLNIDYEPDTFGHNINVPEILSDGGVKYYYHCRGFDKHILYNWKAPSGRAVLVFREPSWYNWNVNGRSALMVPDFCKSHGLKSMLRVYGVGDHGGGPTRRDIERIIEMNSWPIFPEFRFGTYGEFFRLAVKNKETYPTVEGELNFVFDGCYTTQTRQKKANRKSENLLYNAEGIAAMAHLAVGKPYKTNDFTGAWEKIMFNQFHDILPGSGTVDTREYAMGKYQEVYAAAGTNLVLSARALSDASDTSEFAAEEDIAMTRSEGAGSGYGLTEGRVSQLGRHAGKRRLFTVYNPLPVTRTDLAEISVWDWVEEPELMNWSDAEGKNLAHQLVSSGVDEYWGHKHTEVLVKVSVPAMGYTTIVLENAPLAAGVDIRGNDPRVDKPMNNILENEFVKAEVDLKDGNIISLIDKRTNTEFAKPGFPTGVFRLVREDTSRGMSAWWIGKYCKEESLNNGVRITGANLGSQYIRQSISYETEFGNGSKLEVVIYLDAGDTKLKYDVKVRWQEIGSNETFYPQLNFNMPVAYEYESFRYDVPMGVIERKPLDIDVPAQSYGIPVIKKGLSLMLVNDSKYGYRGTPEGLALTLIRSSADPDPWPEVGEHRIQMALAVCGNNQSDEILLSQSFCNKLVAVSAKAGHKGSLPLRQSFLELFGEGLVISAVKQSEDNSGIVLRYYEIDGKAGTGKIELFKKPKSARAVNVLEQDTDMDVRIENKSVYFEYNSYGMGGIMIEF